jgi:hypothetical protein
MALLPIPKDYQSCLRSKYPYLNQNNILSSQLISKMSVLYKLVVGQDFFLFVFSEMVTKNNFEKLNCLLDNSFTNALILRKLIF